MKILLKAKRLTRVVPYVFFGTVIGYALGFAQIAYAEVADLAGAPLTTSATSVVKPNATFILDDSGSMDRSYTPDYVNDSEGSGNKANCYDGGSDITGTPDACEEGDPPWMSPDFNTQYYSPEFTFTPPVNADGSSMPGMGSPWTSVPRDGFGVQSASSTNLVTGFPDKEFCTDDPLIVPDICTKNADYTYPDAVNYDENAITGPPYFYRIVPSEHCTTTELTNCTASATPTGSFIFPAKVRWCDSAAHTNCQKRRVGSFIYPKYLGSVSPGGGVAPTAATGTVQILNSGSNSAVGITSLTVDGVDIISGTITASGGTNSSSERRAAARDLCNAINSHTSIPNYQARNIGSGTTCDSGWGASQTVTIEALITGPAPNGFVVAVGSGASGTTAATVTVTVNSASNGAQLGGARTVGGVAITSGATITASGSTSNRRRRNLANQLRDAINAYSSSPEYTAVRSWFNVIISATVAEGANANGRPVIIPIISGTSLSISNCNSPSVSDAMCGGVTGGGIPTNITNLTGGTDGVPVTLAYRENIGTWARTNIVAANNSYPRAVTRTDCMGSTCTYAEEMTNFANWYAYYRTRMQMMKSSAGRAFVSLGNDYRVGFVTLNPGNNPGGQSPSGYEYVPVSDFDATQKATWYTRFYGIDPNSGTPLREALSRVGRYYAGITSGINSSMTDDPMQYSCQQNISILTTDGFWNGNSGDNLSGSTITNQDNVNSGYSARADGAYDGGLSGTAGSSFGSSDTLADVAMYFYKTDLRPDGSLGALGTDVGTDNNVPSNGKDDAPFQHMTTFTLGLGIDGVMNYQDGYEGASTGDYANIVSGATNCAWAPGVACNWPKVRQNDPTTLDDLWHAAANGRGTYFSARDPASLFQGLSNALASVAIKTGSAAASSTSSPNITQTDRFIYSSTYRTQVWDGEIISQQINTADGSVDPIILWSAQTLLDDKVDTASDTRTIHVFDSGGSNNLKAFTWGGLNVAERAFFADQVCATITPTVTPPEPLVQCTLGMPDADKVEANKAQNMIPYLRGQTGDEGPLYRAREHTLGDTVNSTPAYVRIPSFAFADTGYSAFISAQTNRTAALYVAANDGMLHAFNGNTGDETWAYVPKAIFPTLYKLAATDYGTNHRYYVDGSPTTMDVFDTSASAWKTILVGGLNSGGRGYYALDVTDPAAPKGLWEFCTDSALCGVTDPDLGFTHGNPVITKRDSDGKWVVLVTSGYNNVPDATDRFPDTGNGKGYLYVLDAITGAVLQKIDTGAGNTTTPLGFAKIAAFADDFSHDNTAKWVYGGDLQGNVWRFDLTASPATVMRLATLKDGSSPPRPQSITTRPELAIKGSSPLVIVGTGRYLGTNDLVDGATLIPALPYAYDNSMYVFKDTQTDLGDLRLRSDMQGRTLSTLTPVTRTTTNSPVMNWVTKIGWYIDFNPGGASPGERLNVDPQLILGTLIFATNVPANSACSVGGASWLYQLDYLEGTFVTTAADTVAATKSNNSTVGFVVVKLPSGAIKIIKTESTGAKGTVGVNIGSGGAGGKRVSWRERVY
jgi:type IV pilus assembly protein PilY1